MEFRTFKFVYRCWQVVPDPFIEDLRCDSGGFFFLYLSGVVLCPVCLRFLFSGRRFVPEGVTNRAAVVVL